MAKNYSDDWQILAIQIGERIRKARQEARISQEELAKCAEITSSYMSDIEAGRRNFSVDILLTVTNSLHVTADWVLKGTPMGDEPIPTVNAEVLAVLDGLTADEIQDVILLVKDIKRTIRRSKILGGQ